MESLRLAGVETDLAACPERVEHVNPVLLALTNRPTRRLTDLLTTSHRQGDSGVGGVGEPVNHIELDHRLGGRPPGGEVEDPSAPDGGQLVPVTEERDPGTRLVGDLEEEVLEHALKSKPTPVEWAEAVAEPVPQAAVEGERGGMLTH